MMFQPRTGALQRVLSQSLRTHPGRLSREWISPHPQSWAKNRYGLYSTSSTSTAPTSPSSPSPAQSSPSADTPKSRAHQAGGGLSAWFRRLSLISVSAAAGALAYAKYEPNSVGGFSSLPIGKIQPTILGTEEPDEAYPSNGKPSPEKAKEIKKSVLLEQQMEELDLVKEYKSKAKLGEWKEAEPYWYLTKATKPHHLTAGTLRGENMLSVHPLKFERKDKKAIVLFMHLGRSLCGHDQIIHGGLLATLL
ncbi:hypothetical protein BX616_002661, partial [Lobosporangium transversale]